MQKFDFKDIVLVPETLTDIDSRRDVDTFNDEHFLPIMVSPMDTVVNLENSKVFPYDPKKVSGGFVPAYYIGKLYKLLNLDYKIFNYYTIDATLAYSFLNEEYDWLKYTIVKKNIDISINIDNVFNF
jgi:hypothetical protein